MEAIILTLSSPGPVLLKFGPLIIRWYGVLIAISVIIGLNLSAKLAKLYGLEARIINDIFPILVPLSVIGARLYYVAFEWRNYQQNPIESAYIWKGGIAIHGALIAGVLTVLVFCKLRKQSFLRVLDILFPSVALGQALGRWGNFFNNEAFGVPTKLPWKLFIPINYRPYEYINFEYFHPTFLYESLWNLGVFSLLIFLFLRSNKLNIELKAGSISFIYLIGYSLGRLWIEGLRTDPLCLGSIPPSCAGGIRVAQLVSFSLILIGSIGLLWLYKLKKRIPEISTTLTQNK